MFVLCINQEYIWTYRIEFNCIVYTTGSNTSSGNLLGSHIFQDYRCIVAVRLPITKNIDYIKIKWSLKEIKSLRNKDANFRD